MNRNWYKKYIDLKTDESLYATISSQIKALEKDDHIDVSIVMVAYNEEKRILPSLYSLADLKTGLSVEIIVVNNNSTDNTQEIIDKCGVHSIFQPVKGIGNARQAGLEIARGKYHLCADADTLYPPTYVDAMVKVLKKPGVSAAFCPPSFLADGNKSERGLAIYEVFRDIVLKLRAIKRPEITVGAASLGFLTEPAKAIGWRTDIRRGTDGSMTLALKKIGKVVVFTNSKARIKTTSRTLDADGSFLQMIIIRLRKDFNRLPEYFTAKKEYKDTKANKLKK